MKSMIDIEVVLDENYIDPLVTIRTKEKTEQVDSIIQAIEHASESGFPAIPAYADNEIELVSQRDIIRVYTQGRKVMLQTQKCIFAVRKTLTELEELLNSDRFIQISRSEIVNLYKVKRFDVTLAGTVGVEFANAGKSWVSRSRVKAVKEKLKA